MGISYQRIEVKKGKRIRAFVRYKGRRITKVFTNKSQATSWATRTYSNPEGGIYEKSLSNKPLSEVLDIYLSEKAIELKGAGPTNKKKIVENIQKDHIAAIKVFDLRPMHIRQIQKRLEKRKLKESTVRHYINTISVALKYYIEHYAEELINPCTSIKRPKAHTPRTYKISDDELDSILALLDEEEKACVLLAAITGMRRGEITSLAPDSFDWDNQIITVLAAFSKTNEERQVPMTNALCKYLKAYMKNREQFYSKSPNTLTRNFKNAARGIGCDDYRFHDTRHHALTKLSEASIPARQIQAISGHKRLSTLERYLHEDHDLVATINNAKNLNTPS